MGKKMATGQRLAEKRARNRDANMTHLAADNSLKAMRQRERIEVGKHKPAQRKRTPVEGTGKRGAGDKTGARSRG